MGLCTLPETPLAGAQDVECEGEIRDGVGEDAGGEAAGAVGDEIEKRAGEHCRRPIRWLVFEAKGEATDEEGAPCEGAEWNVGEIFAHEETEEESAPEKFFDEGDDDGHAEESEREICPIRPAVCAEKIRVEAVGARCESEENLRRNPHHEGEEADESREAEAGERAKLDGFPQFPEQDGADECLEREDPIFGVRVAGVALADFLHGLAEKQKRKKDDERREISYAVRTHINHFMGNTSMNPDKTQEANPEQLLKLLEQQVADARDRRTARETSRSKGGTIGLFIIVGGAAIALWMLMLLLDQMRPQRGERRESASAGATEHNR